MIWLQEQYGAVELGVNDCLSWVGAKVCETEYVDNNDSDDGATICVEGPSKDDDAASGSDKQKCTDQRRRPPEDDDGDMFDLVEDDNVGNEPGDASNDKVVVVYYDDPAIAKEDLKLIGGNGEPIILESCEGLEGGQGTDRLRPGMRLILANDEGPDYIDAKSARRALNLNPPVELVFQNYKNEKTSQVCTSMRLIVTVAVGKRRLLLIPTWAHTCVGDSSFTRSLHVDQRSTGIPMEVTLSNFSETLKRLVPCTMLGLHRQSMTDLKDNRTSCKFVAAFPLIALRYFPESDMAAMNSGMSELRAQEVSFGVRAKGKLKAIKADEQEGSDPVTAAVHSSGNAVSPSSADSKILAVTPKYGSNHGTPTNAAKKSTKGSLIFSADTFASSPGNISTPLPTKDNLEGSAAAISKVSKGLGGPKRDSRRHKTENFKSNGTEELPSRPGSKSSAKFQSNVSEEVPSRQGSKSSVSCRGSSKESVSTVSKGSSKENAASDKGNMGGASRGTLAQRGSSNGATSPSKRIRGYDFDGRIEGTSCRLSVKGTTVENMLENLQIEISKQPPECWDAIGVHPSTSTSLNLGMPSCVKCEGPIYPVANDRLSCLKDIPELMACGMCKKPTFEMLYCPSCDYLISRCDSCYAYPSTDQVVAVAARVGVEHEDKIGSDMAWKQLLRQRSAKLAKVLGVSPRVIALTTKKSEDHSSCWDIVLVCCLPMLGPLRRTRGVSGKPSNHTEKFERVPKPICLFLELVWKWKRDGIKAWKSNENWKAAWPPTSLSWLGTTPPKINEVVLAGTYDVNWLGAAADDEQKRKKWNTTYEIASRLFNLAAPEGVMAPSDFAVFQCNVLSKFQGLSDGGGVLSMEHSDVVIQAFFGCADTDGDGEINAEEYFDAQEEIFEVLNVHRDRVNEVLAELEQEKIQAEKDLEKAKREAKWAGEVFGYCKVHNKDFHMAIEKQHIETVQTLLLRGANVQGQYNGESPLHCATRQSSVEICNLLLNFRAKVDSVDSHGNSPLDLACEKLIADDPKAPFLCTMMLKHRARLCGMLDTGLFQAVKKSSKLQNCISVLINGGVDIKAVDYKGRTAIDVAWEIGTPLPGLQALVEKGAMLNLHASSALFEALLHEQKCADESIVKVLLEARAEVTENNIAIKLTQVEIEGTALHVAVKNLNCTEEVIGHVANRSAEEYVLNVCDKKECFALDYAVENQRWTICSILVNLGATLYKLVEEGIFLALARNDAMLLKTMIAAKGSLNATNELGQRPLTLCADMNSTELMELMVADRKDKYDFADLSQTDKFANTALHIAAGNVNTEMCKILLQAAKQPWQCFDLNSPNYKGHTPLDALLQRMISDENCWNGELCKLVSDVGVKPIKLGRDAFFKAIKLKDLNVLKALLNGRVDVNEQSDADGSYPVHVAALAEHPDMLNLFLQYSGDVNSKSINRGDTPLHLAIRAGHSETALKIIGLERCGHSVPNLDHSTPLDEAIWAKDMKVAEKLIGKCAKLGQIGQKEILFNTLTQAQIAKRLGQVDKSHLWVDLAITGGADITAEERPLVPTSPKKAWGLDSEFQSNETSPPKISSTEEQQVENPEVILQKDEKDRDVEVNGGPSHRQPLTLAAYLGLDVVVVSLLRHKADANWKNCEGRTALHYAQPSCVRTLCGFDADARIADRSLNTPVAVVLKEQDDATAYDYIIALLAAQGTKGSGRGGALLGLDQTDNIGNTVFHLAASRGLMRAIVLLMQQPFCYNPNSKNEAHLTPMEVAVRNDHQEVVHLLNSYKP